VIFQLVVGVHIVHHKNYVNLTANIVSRNLLRLTQWLYCGIQKRIPKHPDRFLKNQIKRFGLHVMCADTIFLNLQTKCLKEVVHIVRHKNYANLTASIVSRNLSLLIQKQFSGTAKRIKYLLLVFLKIRGENFGLFVLNVLKAFFLELRT